MGTLNYYYIELEDTPVPSKQEKELTHEMVGHFAKELKELYDLAKRKNHDYGAENIGALGPRGCFVRIWDKVSRLKTGLWEAQQLEVMDEKLKDTLQDLANYAVITILLLEDKWGKDSTFFKV